MASDPRKLKPSELCRLLNSTPLGEVISERQLYRHRQRAGARIGDNKTVDLLRYCAWMHVVRHTPKPTSDIDPYEAMKERARARNAALALAGRDIGELPAVENIDRKDRASRDFRYFCETYFPLTFHLAWSPDHVKVIEKIEQAVVKGDSLRLRWLAVAASHQLRRSHVSGPCCMAIATSFVSSAAMKGMPVTCLNRSRPSSIAMICCLPISGGKFSDSSTRWYLESRKWSALQRQTHTDRLDG